MPFYVVVSYTRDAKWVLLRPARDGNPCVDPIYLKWHAKALTPQLSSPRQPKLYKTLRGAQARAMQEREYNRRWIDRQQYYFAVFTWDKFGLDRLILVIEEPQ